MQNVFLGDESSNQIKDNKQFHVRNVSGSEGKTCESSVVVMLRRKQVFASFLPEVCWYCSIFVQHVLDTVLQLYWSTSTMYMHAYIYMSIPLYNVPEY
jgi:phage-related holin